MKLKTFFVLLGPVFLDVVTIYQLQEAETL